MLQSMESQRVKHDLVTELQLGTNIPHAVQYGPPENENNNQILNTFSNAFWAIPILLDLLTAPEMADDTSFFFSSCQFQ